MLQSCASTGRMPRTLSLLFLFVVFTALVEIAIPTAVFLTYLAYFNFVLGYNVCIGLWLFTAYVIACVSAELIFVRSYRINGDHGTRQAHNNPMHPSRGRCFA